LQIIGEICAFDKKGISNTLVWGEPLNLGTPQFTTTKFGLMKLLRSFMRPLCQEHHSIVWCKYVSISWTV